MALTAQRLSDTQLYSAVVLVDITPRMEPAGVERIVGFMLAHPDGFAALEEAADAIAEIRVEYLPGKTEIRRQIVERAVYRDCRIDDGMRDILNAALRGRPIAPEPQPVAAGGGLVPGGTADHG